MPITNTYNPNPTTVDSLLRQRQTQVDLQREQGLISEETPTEKAKPVKFFGVEQTPDYADKSFFRKVGEDAALLAYAIPVGLAKVATGLVTQPLKTVKELGSGLVQSVKDVVDPEYYKAHPLLGVVNIAGFVAPIAGAAKSAALKAGMRMALSTGVKEAVSLGVEEGVARTALTVGMKEAGGLLVKKGVLGNAVWQAAKTGKIEIVGEVAKNLLKTAGVSDEVALRVATEISNNLYSNFSRQTTKMKVLENMAHPVGSASRFVSGKIDPLRKAIFGNPAEAAVSKLYGAEVVSKNPEGFVAIERWASTQVKERGLEDSIANRQRMMQEWVEQNSQWASLSPEQRVEHFKNYAQSDLTRLKLHEMTGIDIVTVKSLPQSYVDAMVATIKDAPADVDVSTLMKLMEENFGRDFSNHSAEINQSLLKNNTREGMIAAVSKLGDSRSAISFSKFSPEVQTLASELEKTGYRIGQAPKGKPISFAADVFADVPTPVITQELQIGITSSQKENAVVAAKLLEGETLFQAGKIDAGLSKLGEITESTKGMLEEALNDGVTVINKLETNTHGLYFGTPEPSFWLKLKTTNLTETLASLARYAKGNAQDSFITARKLASKVKGAPGLPGLSVSFGKALGNADIIQIEKLANDVGIGMTLNQTTGEAVLYNIERLDGMSPEQFLTASKKAFDSMRDAGYKFKRTIDKYEIGDYTKDNYDELISKSGRQELQSGLSDREIQPGREGQGGVFGEARGRQPTGGISTENALSHRTAFGNWIDRLGLSPSGVIEGAAEYTYRENFTQRALASLVPKYGTTLKVGGITIPVGKLFEWIDRNKALMRQSRIKQTLPLRTVFDVEEADLIRAGFAPEVAAEIQSISKAALREIPASVIGMGDKVINYIRTFYKGYNSWVSTWYNNYLKAAYKGRYDLSPFFSAQQFVETKLQMGLFLRDARMIPGGNTLTKLGDWTIEKLVSKVKDTAPYLKKVLAEPPVEDVMLIRDEVLGTLQKTMLDYTSTPDLINIQNAAKGGLSTLAEKATFEQSIKSRNFWYAVTGQSSVRMAATFNSALAEKFGMTIQQALEFTMENGVKRYKNPQMAQIMKEATQRVFNYSPGVMTSPLMKTLNIVWFPMRFQAKTIQYASDWLNTLSPTSRLIVMNNWVHFANWAGTDEGIKWRRTNRNLLYNIFAYTTAFEQMGQGAEAVTKGRLFGGNAGLIGGVPFGFLVNLAKELAILPEDEDQFDPKTGRRFTKNIPRELISAASLSVSLEQLIISVSPSTPFYSLTGGVIGGVSPRKWIESLVRQVVGAGREALEDRDPSKGRQMLERDFKRVPLEYSRLAK